MDKTKSFDCPNCGNSLDYQVGDNIIRCEYCGTSVFPPGEAKIAESQSQPEEAQFTGNPQQLEQLA